MTTRSERDLRLDPFLRLATIRGIGPRRARALLEMFGSPAAVLAEPDEAAEVARLGPEGAHLLRRAAGPHGTAEVRRVRESLEAVGARALPIHSPDYPPAVQRLSDPPIVLFVLGDPGVARGPGIGVVGTRQPTGTGRRVAREMSRDLAEAGWTVVSGLARGIDTEAHVGALEGRGPTIGVLGHGIDDRYPRRNRELYGRMARSGLIVSEFPPGEPPRPGNFPRRNRLIAALSEALVVVEMAVRSGAQHTVNYALEQGKEVFVVPGPVTSRVSEGTNRLLREGARAVTCAADLLEDLGYGGILAGRTPEPASVPDGSDAGGVLAILDATPRPVDEICVQLDLPADRVLASLLTLELDGRVEALPGKRYRRI